MGEAGSSRRARRPLGLAVVTVVALLAVAALPAAVALRSRPAGPAGPEPVTDESPPFDADGVVDAVRHRITASPTDPATLEVVDPDYRAHFDADGFGVGGLEVALTGVRRRATSVELHPGRWRSKGNIVTRDVARGVRERVTATAGEVEWDVIVDRPLAGAGDLVVTAELRGTQARPEPVEGGHAMSLPVRGTDARMGELVVVDASGAELHRVLPENLRRPGAARGAGPGARAGQLPADPRSDDRTRDEGVFPGPGRRGGRADAARRRRGQQRLARGLDRPPEPGDQLRGRVRHGVATTGQILDPAGIAIASTAANQFDPAVAWNAGAGRFLVVWEDTGVGGTGDLRGARVGTDGIVVDTGGGLPLVTNSRVQREPAVSSDGTNWEIAWVDASNDLRQDTVTPAGTLLLAAIEGRIIDDFDSPVSDPAYAWDGSWYRVTWAQNGHVYWRSYHDNFFAGGINPVTNTTITSQHDPAITYSNSRVLLVWEDDRNGSAAADIYGKFIDATPTIDGFPINGPTGGAHAPDVTPFGTDGFLVSWHNVDADITVQGATVIEGPPGSPHIGQLGAIGGGTGSRQYPALATAGDRVLAVWTGPGVATPDISGRRLDPVRGILDPPEILVSTAGAAPLQFNSAIAWSGSEWLVVWSDSRNSSTGLDIYGTRVDGSGTILNPTGIPISTAVGGQTFPAVSWGGGQFMVVWSDRRSGVDDIFGTRVTGSGVVADPAGIPVSTAVNGQFAPSVTWDGTQYLATWQDARPFSTTDIYASRVSVAGAVLDAAGIAVSTAGGNQTAPVAAGNGSGALWWCGGTGRRARTGSSAQGCRPRGSLRTRQGC